jgi:precorrin-2 dehydrogenase/sirohydrochlorin ferrochelatase
MAGYPITLQLAGKRVLIIGGGKVAERKAPALIDAGANLFIISPEIDESLRGLSFNWLHEEYSQRALSLVRPILVFAATNKPELNQQIAQDAYRANCLVNLASDPEVSDFHNMAVVERGIFTIGISSNGASPALLNLVKERITAVLSDGLVTLGTWLGNLRSKAKSTIEKQEDRQALYNRIVSSNVLALLEAGKHEEAQALFKQLIDEAL